MISHFAGLRPLPKIRVVRGHVLSSAQLRAKYTAVVALPVAPDPEGDGVTPLCGTAEAGVRYGIDLAELAGRRAFQAKAGARLPLDLPRVHHPVPQDQEALPVLRADVSQDPSGLDNDPPAKAELADSASNALPWADLAPRVVLVGVGQGRPQDWRLAGAALAEEAKTGPVLTPMGAESAALTAALVEGFILGGYSARLPHPESTAPGKANPRRAASQAATEPPPSELILLGRYDQAAVAAAKVGAGATMLARDLANWPAAQKTPAAFTAVAGELAKQAGFDLKVLDPAALEAQGLGAILAVGGGAGGQGPVPEPNPYQTKAVLKARQAGAVIDAAWADRSPRLAVATYQPKAPASERGRTTHLVLVGKGITFDTGGLDLKAARGMQVMATDCAGAATALAVVWAAANLELPIQITAILALAENAFGAGSYRPGDVIKTHSGRTVEVVDTDAEGRLVLADALSYAGQLGPDALVDLATLTGAARITLGEQTAALFATDQDLADSIIQAGQVAGEDFWQLPLVEEYLASLDSKVADVSQAPTKSPGGGAIMAALFLRQFAGTARWAHLDLVPARAAKAGPLTAAGATGFATRTLIELARTL